MTAVLWSLQNQAVFCSGVCCAASGDNNNSIENVAHICSGLFKIAFFRHLQFVTNDVLLGGQIRGRVLLGGYDMMLVLELVVWREIKWNE